MVFFRVGAVVLFDWLHTNFKFVVSFRSNELAPRSDLQGCGQIPRIFKNSTSPKNVVLYLQRKIGARK